MRLSILALRAAIAAAVALGSAHVPAQQPAPESPKLTAAEPGALPANAKSSFSGGAFAKQSSKNSADEEIELNKLRMREGTRLHDVSGRFRQNGDSLTFIDDQKREIGGLPNLNLERIIRMLKTVEEPESITWSVSGTITEFSGRNYLLITRAVYKSATPPPAPEALAK